MFVRCRALSLNFAMPLGYVKLCAVLGAIGEVVAGDLKMSRVSLRDCGSFLDESSLADCIKRHALRGRYVLSEEDSKTLGNSLVPSVVAKEGAGDSAKETHCSDAVETSAGELTFTSACAFDGGIVAAAKAPSAHVKGLEQSNAIKCKNERYGDDLCDALRIQLVTWDGGERNDVQQMWAVASANERNMVVDRFAAAFVVYLRSLVFSWVSWMYRKCGAVGSNASCVAFCSLHARGKMSLVLSIFVLGRKGCVGLISKLGRL